MGRVTNIVATIATLSIVTLGAANAQGIIGAIGAVVELCNQVNSVVTTVKNGYDTFKAVANATKQGVPPPRFELPLSESEQRAQDSERVAEILSGIADLRTRMIAIEQWQTAWEDRERYTEQRNFYYRAYSHSELALSAVREALRLTPGERSENLQERLQTRLDEIAGDALHIEPMGQGGVVGEHYVAATNAIALALTALRSLEPNVIAELDNGKRDRMNIGVASLQRAVAFAEAPTSRLSQTARDRTNDYRTQVNALAARRDLAALVNDNNVFHQGQQRACFETVRYVVRPCRGSECPMLPWEDRNLTVPAGYQQTRYPFTLARTTTGSLNILNALDPRVAPETSESDRPAAQCPQRGDPETAWLRVVRAYNEGLREASPAGAEAATAIGALELAAATRESLATLKARL